VGDYVKDGNYYIEMKQFNEKFADALQQIGIDIIDESGKKMTRDDVVKMFNARTLYEIEGKWYTRDSIFYGNDMLTPYNTLYKGNSIPAEELSYYMLNDCCVSGLCVALYNNKFGILPLEKRTGSQSGIWSCEGYPFIYDDVRVFTDWFENEWKGYGYVAAKKEERWGVMKITQFPEPKQPELVSDFMYPSPEEAMEAAGIEELQDEEPRKTSV